MSKRVFLIAALSAAAGLLLGVNLSNWVRLAPTPTDSSLTVISSTQKRLFLQWESRRYTDTTKKSEVTCPENATTILVLGQSNGANSVGERTLSQGPVYQWFAGKCYKADSPMLGSEGLSGSIWPIVGDLLSRPVIFITAAIGGSSAKEWADQTNDDLYLNKILDHSPQPTHVLWMQGEQDTIIGTTKENYSSHVKKVIEVIQRKSDQINILISRTSYCRNLSSPFVINAQNSLIDPKRRIFPGPFTDAIIGDENRHDDCHFSMLGARKVAAAWAAEISKTLN